MFHRWCILAMFAQAPGWQLQEAQCGCPWTVTLVGGKYQALHFGDKSLSSLLKIQAPQASPAFFKMSVYFHGNNSYWSGTCQKPFHDKVSAPPKNFWESPLCQGVSWAASLQLSLISMVSAYYCPFSVNILFCWVPGTPLTSWAPQDTKAGCWDIVTWRGIPQFPYRGKLLDAHHCCTCLQNFWWVVHVGFECLRCRHLSRPTHDLETLELGPPCSACALSSEWVSFQAQLRHCAMGLPCQILACTS